MHDIEVFKKMIEALKAIELTKPTPPTFMEISGYPHFENVCSNILSFFLTVDECHGLGDVLIRSLLCAAGQTLENTPVQDVVVERENTTDQRKRLDLVIESDSFIIGVENKILSCVNNDLKHYAEHISKRNINGKKTVLILLSLHPIKGMNMKSLHSFIPITYEQWFSKIQLMLGQYALACDQKYLIYLLDFMQTIERLGGRSEMNNEMIEFFRDNREAIYKLLREAKVMRSELKREASDLAHFITYDENSGIRQWVWTSTEDIESALVHDLPFLGDRNLAVNVLIHPVGISIEVFTRKPGSENLEEWLVNRHITVKRHVRDRLICADFPYGADKQEVGVAVTQLLKKMSVNPADN